MLGHSGVGRDRPEGEDQAKDETIRLFGKTSNIGDIRVQRRLTGGTDRVWIFIIRFPAGKELTNLTRRAQSHWTCLASQEGEGAVNRRATTGPESLGAPSQSREGRVETYSPLPSGCDIWNSLRAATYGIYIRSSAVAVAGSVVAKSR